MELYNNIHLVGHVSGYYYQHDIMPVEVCIASVQDCEKKRKYYIFDLSDVCFSATDKIVNKYFSEKYLGLEFPPPKWQKTVKRNNMKRYLHALYDIQRKDQKWIIGCVGEKQRKFFLKYGLPCVNITPFVPPYEDLQDMPLFSKHKVHKPHNLPFCSMNYAHRYAAYLNKKIERLKADKSSMMYRLSLGWKFQ